MKITRIDNDRDADQEIERIQIQIGASLFTLTESFGELRIRSHDGHISVKPGCANEIKVLALDS